MNTDLPVGDLPFEERVMFTLGQIQGSQAQLLQMICDTRASLEKELTDMKGDIADIANEIENVQIQTIDLQKLRNWAIGVSVTACALFNLIFQWFLFRFK